MAKKGRKRVKNYLVILKSPARRSHARAKAGFQDSSRKLEKKPLQQDT